MDNPEKLGTQDTQDEKIKTPQKKPQKTKTIQYVLHTTMHKHNVNWTRPPPPQ